jgi:hypothetical protein
VRRAMHVGYWWERKKGRKRQVGRPRRSLDDNIKMDLRGIEWGGMNCINLVQDREQWKTLLKTVINLRFP